MRNYLYLDMHNQVHLLFLEFDHQLDETLGGGLILGSNKMCYQRMISSLQRIHFTMRYAFISLDAS